MELEVQKYLRSGKTLNDLFTEHGVKANINPDMGIVNLTYIQYAADPRDNIANECRALILELDTWDVVFKGFNRFYNYGEPWASRIDFYTAVIQEKTDGVLLNVWNYKGQWHLSTKGTTQAEGPVWDEGMTFRELALMALKDMGLTWEEFTDALDPYRFYAFELVAPELHLVVQHKERKLILLASWMRGVLGEVTPYLETDKIEVVKSIPFTVTDMEAIVAWVNERDPDLYEGVVIVDAQYRRIKVKSTAHVLASKLRDPIDNPKTRLEAILLGKADDILPLIPDCQKEVLLGTMNDWKQFVEDLHKDYTEYKNLPTKKEFAAKVSKKPYSMFLFKMYDGGKFDDLLKRRIEVLGAQSMSDMFDDWKRKNGAHQ